MLHREIDLASMRWAREGELLPVGEPTAKSVSPVFYLCPDGVAGSQAVFRECGEPIPSTGGICHSVSCGCKKNSASVCGMFSKISVRFELSFPRPIRLMGVRPAARTIVQLTTDAWLLVAKSFRYIPSTTVIRTAALGCSGHIGRFHICLLTSLNLRVFPFRGCLPRAEYW